MKKLTPQQLELCRLQGALFEASLELCACSSPVFVRRFMNSQLAKRFDDGTVLLESSTMRSLINELNDQYGPSAYGKVRYGSEVMYWMGYVYRYWNATFGLSSKGIFKVIQARELSELYYPYHSLDPEQAIERICDAKGKSPGSSNHSDGYIEEGVALLRRMHERPEYDYYVIGW